MEESFSKMSLEGEEPLTKNLISLKWRDERDQVNVYKLREVFSPYWRDLGRLFGFHESLLSNFATLHRENPEQCFSEVVSQWQRDGSVPRTAYAVSWGGLMQALRDLGRLSREVDKLETAVRNRVEEADSSFTEGSELNAENQASSQQECDVKVALKSIQKKFALLLSSTRRSLKSQGVDAAALAACLLDLSYTSSDSRETSVLLDISVDLLQADSIDRIFALVSAHSFWSFFNFDLLVHVISECGVDCAELLEYGKAFEEFCRHKVSDLPENALQSVSENGAKKERVHFKIKIYIDHPVLKRISNVKERIAEILEVPTSALFVNGVQSGCVEVEFLVPQCVTLQLFPLSDEQKHSLYHQAHVVRIKWRGMEMHLDTELGTPLEASAVPPDLQEPRPPDPLPASVSPVMQEDLQRALFASLRGVSLVEASKKGLDSEVKVLLEDGADVNFRNEYGQTALLLACLGGRTDVVTTLLSAPGVLVNSAANTGLTALHAAAHEGHSVEAALLLQHHADVNKLQQGYPPLYVAAQEGHTDLAALLLLYNADVNLQALDAYTPLHIAAQKGRTALVELLLQYHADTDLQTEDGKTALWNASFNGHVQVADLLLKANASVNTPEYRGATPLFVAAQVGHTAVVALLLQYHADGNLQAQNGAVPLHVATATAVVELLLQYHADTDLLAANGATPLFMAALNGRTAVVELLLQYHADTELRAQRGETALWQASANGHTQVANLLLKAKASVDTPNNDGVTPLHVAVKQGHTRVAALLLQYHADVNLRKTDDSLTPLHLAVDEGHVAMVELMLQYHADTDLRTKTGVTALLAASLKGQTEVADLLLKANASVDTLTIDGATPLYVAAQEGHTGVASLLLQHHADVNLQEKGVTPLCMAASRGHTGVVALLLQHHADANLQMKGSVTPLMAAAYQGHDDVIQELLTNEAHVDQQDEIGRSALMVAVQYKRRDTTALLLSAGANPDLQEEEGGRTALMSAAQDGDLDAVQLLCVFGANPHIVDRVGATAAAIASAHDHTDVHCALVEYIEQTEPMEAAPPTERQQQQGEPLPPTSVQPSAEPGLVVQPEEDAAAGQLPPPEPQSTPSTEDTDKDVLENTEAETKPLNTSSTDEKDVWDIIQLSNTVNSRMRAFDDEYLFQAYRDMFWKDDPEDSTPTLPRHMTSQPAGSGSRLIQLTTVGDEYDDLYS